MNLLCNSGWSQTHKDPSDSASQALRSQVGATVPSLEHTENAGLWTFRWQIKLKSELVNLSFRGFEIERNTHQRRLWEARQYLWGKSCRFRFSFYFSQSSFSVEAELWAFPLLMKVAMAILDLFFSRKTCAWTFIISWFRVVSNQCYVRVQAEQNIITLDRWYWNCLLLIPATSHSHFHKEKI